MIRTRFQLGYNAKIGAQETASEFGHEFFAGALGSILVIAREIPPDTMLWRCPVGCFMAEDRNVGFGVSEALKRRHLDVIAGRCVKGFRSAVADDRAGIGKEPVRMLDPLDRVDHLVGPVIIMIGQALDLIGAEHRIGLEKRNAALDLVASSGEAREALRRNTALFRQLMTEAGYGPDNPVKFTIQTTKGFKPKDYEMIQAIVGLWRRVGIEAEIEVYEVARHYELRAADQLAPAAFYNWGNSVGDPTTSTGFAMFGPSPHSVWDSQDLIDMIAPLWAEPNEERRIQGWKDVDRYIAEHAYVLPLLQYVQPIIHANGVHVTPHASGALLPHLMTRA